VESLWTKPCEAACFLHLDSEDENETWANPFLLARLHTHTHDHVDIDEEISSPEESNDSSSSSGGDTDFEYRPTTGKTIVGRLRRRRRKRRKPPPSPPQKHQQLQTRGGGSCKPWVPGRRGRRPLWAAYFDDQELGNLMGVFIFKTL